MQLGCAGSPHALFKHFTEKKIVIITFVGDGDKSVVNFYLGRLFTDLHRIDFES